MDGKKLGWLGEEAACRYLEKRGYKIIERNYIKNWSAFRKGEIDIIARKSGAIFFIEVKTSVQDFNKESYFLPENRVNFKKKRQIESLAQSWLFEHNFSVDSQWQIDVVSVQVDLKRKKARIKHFENIF